MKNLILTNLKRLFIRIKSFGLYFETKILIYKLNKRIAKLKEIKTNENNIT
jgi:hypothetical protein